MTRAPSSEFMLDIEGMTCASCVSRIERVLRHVEGAVDATVNLATRTARVSSMAADPDPFIRAVEKAGYGARVHRDASLDRAETKEYLRRLTVSGFLSFYVLMLSLGGHSRSTLFAAAILATPVQFYGGWPFLRGAIRGLKHHVHTMDTLIATGSLAAYGYSVWSLAQGRHDGYFDTSAMIITLILAGKTIEAATRAKAGSAARLLMKRGATSATVVRDGKEEQVPAEEVRVGDTVVVLPGQKIPTDGTISEGRSAIDLALLTGESVPVDVGPGDEVFGASVNGQGRLVLVATRVGLDTKLAEIVRLLEATQASKAPIERVADRVSARFVPWILGVAGATLFAWYFLATGGLGGALLHATAVLLIACPCALGLATPAAVMAGSGRAAELGILFRGGEVFEAARRIDTVLLDKTGTVTLGKMQLRQVLALPGEDANAVLSLAAAAEVGSEHPIARAVVDGAIARGLEIPEGTGFEAQPGAGVEALVAGVRVRVGRPDGRNEVLGTLMSSLSAEGHTLFAVWVDERPVGLLAAADTVKEEARNAIGRMRAYGFDVALVTGDRRAAAEAVARETGIERVVAEVFPEGKVEEIKRLQAAGKRVAFVGDGMNDGPALVQADVGIALGTGTDVAIEAADVKIMGGDLTRVADSLFLARGTYAVIAQNLAWAFAYNLLMVPLAAFGKLTPLMASVAMAASSVSVVANAVGLRRYRWRRSVVQEDGTDPLEALRGVKPEEIRSASWSLAWW